jgi:hypothetical protein
MSRPHPTAIVSGPFAPRAAIAVVQQPRNDARLLHATNTLDDKLAMTAHAFVSE